MKMLNSDHQPHITGTPMPHGKPQIHIGCGGNMRDQGDTTRNQFILSVYVKSALLDSIYESIPKVFAGQPFFITYSTQFLNQTRSVQQPIAGVQPMVGVVFLSLHAQIEGTLGTKLDTSKRRPGNALSSPGTRRGVAMLLPSGSIQTGCPSLSQCDRE